MKGRDYVTPDDVRELAHPVLEHRLILSSQAAFSGRTAGDVLEEILKGTVPPPDADGILGIG